LNKREKELVELLYGQEQDVLKELERQYRKTLDEINLKIRILQSDELTQSKVYQLQYQEALKKQIEGLVEKLHGDEYTTIQQYLHDSYTTGFVGAMYSIHGQGVPLLLPIDQNAAVKAILTDSKINEGLYDSLGVDANNLKKKIRQEITRGIAGGMTYNDIARNITATTKTPLSNARRIVQTEGHRIQQAATYDAQQASKAKGADVVKQWDSTLDGATRPTHRKLDGQIREVKEPFEEDGKKAMFPGDFGDPAEDCNCRCVSLTRARWALDEDELQTLKDRAEYFGLTREKTKSFEEFQKKYLKALDGENEYKLVRAGRIEANGLFVNNQEKLYRYAKDIKPIDGFEDFTCHADPDGFLIDLKGNGNPEDYIRLTPKEYAERIRNSSTYKGGNVRIISCQAGAKKDGAAQQLANELGVSVYAPTEIVNIDENGEMFISDNDILAELWYNASDKNEFKPTGEWKLFEPQKG